MQNILNYMLIHNIKRLKKRFAVEKCRLYNLYDRLYTIKINFHDQLNNH